MKCTDNSKNSLIKNEQNVMGSYWHDMLPRHSSEYRYPYAFKTLLSIASLELGLRWLHDRARGWTTDRCIDCALNTDDWTCTHYAPS